VKVEPTYPTRNFPKELDRNGVRESEFSDASLVPGDPAEHIDFPGVGQAVRNGVRDHVQQRVSAQVLEVIDSPGL